MMGSPASMHLSVCSPIIEMSFLFFFLMSWSNIAQDLARSIYTRGGTRLPSEFMAIINE